MKTLKSRMAIAAAAFLLAASALPITAKNIVAGPALPQAKSPVLKIGGKADSAVCLQSLDIQIEVTGSIASTRHTLVFKNKTARDLEGELTFPLPDGRSVTYYAVDVNGKMREAVPVDKAKATAIFEEIERRQVDPGLLERVEGNNFRTRIYPIPANGIRTVAIGYEEELPPENELLRYRLPMAYSDSLERFSVTATVWKSGVKPIDAESGDELIFDKAGENYVASFIRKNHRPAGALNFALPAPVDAPRVIMQPARGSHCFLASITPKAETRKKQWADDLAIIWDVSLSGSQRDLRRETEILEIIFAEKKNANVHLYFLNNKLKKITNDGNHSGESGTEVTAARANPANGGFNVIDGKWDELKNTLNSAVFDGGTDFSQIDLNGIAGNEILFFSDGISTLSDADSIKNITVKRPIHCVVSSAKADYSVMKLTAGKTWGKFVNLNALSSEQLKTELLNETLQFLGTEHGESVREVYPSIASPVHGGFSLSGISDTNDAEVTLLFGFGNTVKKRFKIRLNAKNAGEHGNVHKLWAQKKITELDLNYKKNSAELTELGQQFGIVTRNTSLIVLETVGDYIRYNITPPAELLAEYLRTRKESEEKQRDTKSSLLKNAFAAANAIRKWWNTDFSPKQPKYPTPPDPPEDEGRRGGGVDDLYGVLMAGGGGRIDDMLGGLMGGGGGSLEIRMHGSLTISSSNRADAGQKDGNAKPVITVKPTKKNNDYLNKLTGKNAEDYQIYLKLRDDYADSPDFYFDMADWFYTHNDKKTALLVLTSIADLELENASLYRLLGYRFKEYGEYALEKFVCRKVIQWRPMEPQSYRDYALALADNGETQAALDSLYGMLTKSYSKDIGNRATGIEEAAIMEINRLLAQNANLNKSKINRHARINSHVDIRVVINWNMDNTDIDLHIKDPNDNDCYYGNTETEIGGRISADNTSGYGPEQFLLKKAVKGKYKVCVNYFGDRRVTPEGQSTVMAEVYTKYAGKTEQRRIVCLQLSKARKKHEQKDEDDAGNGNDGDDKYEYVEVAEFEF